MTFRPTDHILPPLPAEADRKAVRAFWRGAVLGWLVGVIGCLLGVTLS
jgi:hypothetical protein